VVIKFLKNDRWIRKRINLDSEYTDSYEEKIREDYGKNVRIELLQFHRTKPTIINDKHTRTALALGYVKYSEEIIEKNKKSFLEENLNDLNSLEKYDEIIRTIFLKKSKFTNEKNLIEESHDFEIRKTLQNAGLMDKDNKLNTSLSQDKKNRKDIEKNIFAELGSTLILWDIFRYYLTSSNDRRKRYGGPFPYLRGDIDRQQRQIFTHLNNKAICLLKKYEDKKILEIDDMDLLLHNKFKLEMKIKGTNMKIDHVALGAAIILLHKKIPIVELSKTFNINEDNINRELKNIEIVDSPHSAKSNQFLEMIKK
jgi:Zn-finger domain-containing protein